MPTNRAYTDKNAKEPSPPSFYSQLFTPWLTWFNALTSFGIYELLDRMMPGSSISDYVTTGRGWLTIGTTVIVFILTSMLSAPHGQQEWLVFHRPRFEWIVADTIRDTYATGALAGYQQGVEDLAAGQVDARITLLGPAPKKKDEPS